MDKSLNKAVVTPTQSSIIESTLISWLAGPDWNADGKWHLSLTLANTTFLICLRNNLKMLVEQWRMYTVLYVHSCVVSRTYLSICYNILWYLFTTYFVNDYMQLLAHFISIIKSSFGAFPHTTLPYWSAPFCTHVNYMDIVLFPNLIGIWI